MPWPLPAVGAWASAWLVFLAIDAVAGTATAFTAGTALGAVVAAVGNTPWRCLLIGCGFPLSFALSAAAAGMPQFAWLVPLMLLALVYPLRAWRDAPLFPTPRGALRGLATQLPLPADARILDAGCGLGDALVELRREYPGARLVGVEQSAPLRVICALRCPFAQVRKADMWSLDWSAFDLVYLFQRPESMARAAARASRDLKAGGWLASLEFEIAGCLPDNVFACADGRKLRLYTAEQLTEFTQRGQSQSSPAGD